jgi:alpha-ribazole phosphatase
MIIIAVRHTSVTFPKEICYGQTDIELASTYEVERNEVAQKLSCENYQALYSSPLKRCQKLAESISKEIPVIYDSRLMELNFGKWEGQNWDDIIKTEEAKSWFNDWINTPCPQGESYQQLISRVQEFIQQIKALHNNKNVLIVTHGGIIRALISILSDIEPKKTFGLKIDFGSITKLKLPE